MDCAQPGIQGVDLLHLGPGRPGRILPEEGLLLHLGFGRQKASLFRGIPLENPQRSLRLGLFLPGLGKSLAVQMAQFVLQLRLEVLIGLFQRGLAHLHTSHVLEEAKDGLPVFRHGYQAQMFHFYNSHQRFTTFSTISWAA